MEAGRWERNTTPTEDLTLEVAVPELASTTVVPPVELLELNGPMLTRVLPEEFNKINATY
jgi:hypothetical protein